MIGSGSWSPTFDKARGPWTRWLRLFASLVLILIPIGAGSGDDFSPLFFDSSLQHSLGDKDYWIVRDGVLLAKTDAHRSESEFLLREERFGNFILKFQARSDGASLDVLFRTAILPPGQLAGFAATLGGEQWGSLTFRKPIPQFQQVNKQEPGHAAPGFPDALAMPFLREAQRVALVASDSSKAGTTFPRGQWVDCEIDALGNHILVKVNGTITARFIVDSSFYQKVVGVRPSPEMLGNHAPFYEGMIGFRLPPETTGKVELKDIQIKILGDVEWPEEATAQSAVDSSKEKWKASEPSFQRITDSEWSQESQELLKTAQKDEDLHPIFDGKTLQGWNNTASFWTAQDGMIVGQPRNVFLITDRDYSDFVLKGAVRLSPPGGNSGVQVRSVVIPDGMRGYQFDMGIPWWGQLYVESTMRGILAPVEDRMKRANIIRTDGWNDFVIICKGNHLIGELNGELTYDFVDYYGDKSGLIGLQIHSGAAMQVDFKDLKIKELH